MTVSKLVSGGQTGADRGALAAARAAGVAIGGWVPRGRLAEDGRVPEALHELQEAESEEPAERTRLNVRDSDGTLILSHGPLAGGSALTRDSALELGRPCLWLDRGSLERDVALARAVDWIEREQIAVLNVAGPRASEDPRIERESYLLLSALFERLRLRR